MSFSKSSAYFGTEVEGTYLGIWNPRDIKVRDSDVAFTITPPYDQRPDLLAADIYGTPNLWWVFAVRNPNSLPDPLFSFKKGVRIYLPLKESIFEDLGLV